MQVGDPEVRDGTLGFLGELEARDAVVRRISVVVPGPAEDVRRVLDVHFLAVVQLVILRLAAGPRRATHRLDERGHPRRGTVRVIGGHAGRRMVEGPGLTPTPEDAGD